MMSFLAILTGAALAAQPVAEAPAPSDAPPVVADAYMVAIDTRDPAGGIVKTTRIAHRPGTSCYNWVIAVPPEDRSIAIREEFRLPAPAAEWNSAPEEGLDVAADRRSGVTRFDVSLAEGLITHGWCVAKGDPLGAYRIRVYAGGRLLKQFDFLVVPDGDSI